MIIFLECYLLYFLSGVISLTILVYLEENILMLKDILIAIALSAIFGPLLTLVEIIVSFSKSADFDKLMNKTIIRPSVARALSKEKRK